MSNAQIAAENFDRWNAALATKNPSTVAALYTTDATFLPTVSGEFKQGTEGAEEYFIHFLEKDPVGTITESAVQKITDTHYLHSGMYTFKIGPQDNRQSVSARFTYMWTLINNEWFITHHHSSIRPQ